MSYGETIFALSSAPGRAGVAVIRVSGPQAGAALEALTGRALPPPRRATRAFLQSPKDGRRLDDGLVIWFAGPQSFTGEDVAELHVHGGRAVVDGVAEALGQVGLRPAEPGEFTRRAFDNGKMDLTAAEGVADLINAETEAQRRQALGQMEGGLAGLYDGWRTRLVGLMAQSEATIDFSDEDLPEDLESDLQAGVAVLAAEIRTHLDDGHRGEMLRDGISIAIIGPPNAGKSSLINQLARRDAAIVSAEAGTTRDVIEVHLNLGGYPVIVADTAGLRETALPIEAEGIRRARRRAEDADLKLALFDGEAWPDFDVVTASLLDDDTVVSLNKADLVDGTLPNLICGRPCLAVSATTGQGLDELTARLEEEVSNRVGESGGPTLTRARHRTALVACVAALERSAEAGLVELAAEDLRLAAQSLGRITGRVDVEQILDVVFGEFCIGK